MPHIHEKIDFTAEVFIVYKGKVLLRMHDKYHIWLSVGGHIELDEDPNEAAVREVQEEVGLDVVLHGQVAPSTEKDFKDLIPPEFVSRHRINATHEHVVFVYFATAISDVLTLSEAEMTSECKWFTREDLLSGEFELRDNVKRYALAALDVLG
jgi:ADP-ribose pyrophosphatase YjhB (NUDIX family)